MKSGPLAAPDNIDFLHDFSPFLPKVGSFWDHFSSVIFGQYSKAFFVIAEYSKVLFWQIPFTVCPASKKLDHAGDK